MKFKLVCIIAILTIGVLCGSAIAANNCLTKDCHGTSSDVPAPHNPSHVTCTDCHRDDDSCTNVTVVSSYSSSGSSSSSYSSSSSSFTSSSSSSGINIFGEIVDLPVIKASAVDTWKMFNSGGIGTFVLGSVFLAASLSIILGFAGGIAIGGIGGLTKKPGVSTLGESMVATAWKYAILFPIGLIGLFLTFAFI